MRKSTSEESKENALITAINKFQKWRVENLIKNGELDVNKELKNGKTALMMASENGDCEMINLLLGMGANVDKGTKVYGFTALMMATRNGEADAVTTLLKNGADASKKLTNGRTALIMVPRNNNNNIEGIIKRHIEKEALEVREGLAAWSPDIPKIDIPETATHSPNAEPLNDKKTVRFMS
jgi:ankyrin repeat protein